MSEVIHAPYPKKDLHNILSLLKNFKKPIHTLYTPYITLASRTIAFRISLQFIHIFLYILYILCIIYILIYIYIYILGFYRNYFGHKYFCDTFQSSFKEDRETRKQT